MKTSFVATVLNEEEFIEEFITSILNQTQQPDEIIIVDAGSTDSTQKILKKFKKIKIFFKKGNRSVGRNYGIKNSIGDIIIVSDAGCLLDKNFILNITSSFKNNSIDVASGFYYPITNNIFEKCLAAYTCVMPDKLDKDNFLPSSRSIAFKRSAFDLVNGYPEHLDTCEDLIFAVNMKKNGLKFKFKKNAYVHWRQQATFIEAFKQFYNYAKGDGQARYFRPQTPLLYIRYIIGTILLSIAVFTKNYTVHFLIICITFSYIYWVIKKNYKYVNEVRAIFYLPLLQIVADIAVIVGTSFGILNSVLKNE